MACGSIDTLVGGTMVQSTVVNSTVQGSTVTDSVLNTATITNLASIDDSSAQTILDAIVGSLDESDLQKLADKLMPLMTVSTTVAPDTDTDSEVPTTMAGSREFLLGKPDTWLEIGEHKVPAYD